jgi:hypothetical protein
MPTRSPKTSATRGWGGCLFALLLGGAGAVLTALGLAPATTEALPFGAALLGLGVIVGVASALRVRGTLPGDAGSGAPGDVAARPPTTIACAQCGAPAPLCVSEPTHATCSHCQARMALPAELVERLRRSAALLERQRGAERQISATITKLAARERSFGVRLAVLTVLLGCLALGAATFGWLVRLERSDWHAIVALGGAAGATTLGLAASAALIVPRLLRRIVGRWTALELPGARGLACRACGAPLPAMAAPVLRCGHCDADNLAGSDVVARLARGVRAAEQRVLAVAEGRRQGEEIAAFALVAFPLIALLTWFAAGAVAGSVVIGVGSEIELPPDGEQRYVLVRTGPRGAARPCVARIEASDDRTTLALGGLVRTIEPDRLRRIGVGAPFAAGDLVGRNVRARLETGRVVSAYRRLAYLRSHVLRLENGSEVYLPWDEGGQSVCLDEPAGDGELLPPPPASP